MKYDIFKIGAEIASDLQERGYTAGEIVVALTAAIGAVHRACEGCFDISELAKEIQQLLINMDRDIKSNKKSVNCHKNSLH